MTITKKQCQPPWRFRADDLREFWRSVGLSRRFAINDPNQLGPTGTAAAQAKTKIPINVKDTSPFRDASPDASKSPFFAARSKCRY